MKRSAVLLPLAFFAVASVLPGQSPPPPSSPATVKSGVTGGAKQTAPAANSAAAKKAAKAAKKAEVRLKPFSRVALGGGFSLMGVNLQAATNLDRYLNLRGTGNVFNYTDSNISTNGFNMSGKVNMATAGVALDYYPFPKHGFRLSPGVLFYNQNSISASGSPTLGKAFTLDDQDFLSAPANNNPLTVTANLGLNTHKQAFTLTTGWGNVIPRKRDASVWSRLSFPFEFGAAFTGAPTLNMTLSGLACPTSNDSTCSSPYVDMNTNQQAQSDLNAQLVKWRNDLNPLKVYPIFSFGVAYEFHTK